MGMQGLRGLFGGPRRGAVIQSARLTTRSFAPRPRPSGRPEPQQALEWLKAGNAVFVAAGAHIQAHERQEITELAKGQSPLAVIVGCSDSRVSPEILFHCRLGDLFVVRVAGATVDPVALGSVEYAVHHLNCPLVVVLGHTGCGAVAAAAKAVTDNAEFDGAIEDLVLPILPSVLKAKAAGANDLVNASVREHVAKMARRLNGASSLAAALGQGRLKVTGGYYDLHSGRVEFIA